MAHGAASRGPLVLPVLRRRVLRRGGGVAGARGGGDGRRGGGPGGLAVAVLLAVGDARRCGSPLPSVAWATRGRWSNSIPVVAAATAGDLKPGPCPVGPTTGPILIGPVGRGGGSGREKFLTGVVGHGVSDVLDAVSLFGGDAKVYPSPTFPDARVKTPNLRIGRWRRSGVVPFVKAPPWEIGRAHV